MDVEHFKKILNQEKEKLIKEIGYYKSEDPYVGTYRGSETLDDAITGIEGHDRVTATKSELEISLKETEEALQRIEEGTYGICTDCGQKISPERLEIMPTAALCKSCQAKKKGA